jgi:hypothetical protein
VRVGRTRATAAPWYVRDQRAVDALLARLLALRSVEGAAEELLRSVPPEDVQRVHLTLDRLIASLEARTDR